MRKNKVQEKLKSEASKKGKKNYGEYGYRADAKVEMNGSDFAEILTALRMFQSREIQLVFDIDNIGEDGRPTPKRHLTEKGMIIAEITGVLESVHEQMVDSGVAEHRDILEKSRMSLRKEDESPVELS